jgi:hypothetical protein
MTASPSGHLGNGPPLDTLDDASYWATFGPVLQVGTLPFDGEVCDLMTRVTGLCVMCEEPFPAKRRYARTCSPRCRVALHRARSRPGWAGSWEAELLAEVDSAWSSGISPGDEPDWSDVYFRWERRRIMASLGVPRAAAKWMVDPDLEWGGGPSAVRRCICGREFDRTRDCCSALDRLAQCPQHRRFGGYWRTRRKYCSNACRQRAYRLRRGKGFRVVTPGLDLSPSAQVKTVITT